MFGTPIAGLISYNVSSTLGVRYDCFTINRSFDFNFVFFYHIILAGIFFGIGGTILVIIAILFTKDYLGLGLETISVSLDGEPVKWYTTLTLNFGGSGGIVTPIFFIGSNAGNLFAQIFHLDIKLFSSLGFVPLLAGATNTPIAASIMAIEMFGPQIAPYAALLCLVSYLMTGHRSVYPSQILLLS